MFSTLDMATGGLRAQRQRMDTIAGNVLNSQTTRDANGQANPYQRRVAVLASGSADDPRKPGVRVDKIELDRTPFNVRHDPGHPDADPKTGLVRLPNVDVATEHVNMLEASRAYEANVAVARTTRSMINASLRLIG